MYDTTLGRFLQRDPISASATGANVYRYVHDRPTELKDPTGLDACAPPTRLRCGTLVAAGKDTITEENYQECWKKIGNEVVAKALNKVKGGKEAQKVLSALGCFEAKTTKELAKKCMSLVCKFAPVPPCKVLKAGEFLEACGKVLVTTVAEAIIPNSMERLAKGWEGVDCSTTQSRASCNLCCKGQYEYHSDENKFLDCQAECNKKKD